ncbi:MAG: cell division ATP-binding protein FtsE [Acidiferrobacteraceae bacterium]
MIELSHVSKRYVGGHEALRDVTLRIERDEMVFITGHSGAGKSTLLKLVAGIEQPTRGQVIVDGKNLTRLRRAHMPVYRRRLGIIFQDNKFLHDRNVLENVGLPLAVRGAPAVEIRRRASAALDKVGLLNRAHAMPITLSGGEQQRVGIARAIVHRPDVLLADEPTGNLDPELSDTVMDLFREFNEYHVTVVIATHDRRHITRLGKRALHLHGGAIVMPDAVLEPVH